MLSVIKTGGKVITEGLSDLVLDIKTNHSKDHLILIHGGGNEVTEIAAKMGKQQKFVVSPRGFRSRYTDRETVDIYTMVMMGIINKRIVASLQRNGLPSIGLSGIDGSLIKATRKKRILILDERGRKRVIDGDYSGEIEKVDSKLLNLLIKKGYIPVVAPIALSEEFEPLNTNGDRIAAHIAGALKADRLILLTNVDGIFINKKLIRKITTSDLEKMQSKIGHGMFTKTYAALEASKLGVKEVIISSGLEKAPITSAITNKTGTVICHG